MTTSTDLSMSIEDDTLDIPFRNVPLSEMTPEKPPAEGKARTRRAGRKNGPTTREINAMEMPLAQLYAGIGQGAMVFSHEGSKTYRAGELAIANSPTCAKAWVAVAKENPQVARVLAGMLVGSTWSMVMIAHWPFIQLLMEPSGEPADMTDA